MSYPSILSREEIKALIARQAGIDRVPQTSLIIRLCTSIADAILEEQAKMGYRIIVVGHRRISH